jgi:hypothetical protein
MSHTKPLITDGLSKGLVGSGTDLASFWSVVFLVCCVKPTLNPSRITNMESIFSLDQVAAALPETVKRNILARLLSPDNVVVSPLGSDRPATVQPAIVPPQSVQPGQARSIRYRQLVVPSLDAGAALVDGVLSQQEVQVRPMQGFFAASSFGCGTVSSCHIKMLLLVPACGLAHLRLLLLQRRRGCPGMGGGRAWAAAVLVACGMILHSGVTSTAGSHLQSLRQQSSPC